MNLNISCPLNSVSFGAVSYNILKQLYLKGLSPHWFPIGNIDLSSFDKAPEDMKMWLTSCAQKALKGYSRKNPEFKMWHVNGSDVSHSNEQTLLTFHETSEITDVEKNILNNQKNVLVTSNYTKDVMEKVGVNNISVVHLGFDDENYKKVGNHPYNSQAVVFGHCGKFERTRKKTDRIIKMFAAKYGNNPKYRLHLHCYNGFLNADPNQCRAINAQLVEQVLEGKRIWNINLINNHIQTLTEYNQMINSIDIFLDASGAEGWGLPAFHATALGKYLVSVNAGGAKEWTTAENAVLVEPNGMIDSADQMFFHPGQPFNQGQFANFKDEEFIAGMEKAVELYEKNPVNQAGLELQKKFQWSDTVDRILEKLK